MLEKKNIGTSYSLGWLDLRNPRLKAVLGLCFKENLASNLSEDSLLWSVADVLEQDFFRVVQQSSEVQFELTNRAERCPKAINCKSRLIVALQNMPSMTCT